MVRAEVKAAVMAKLETAVDQAVAKGERAERLTLNDIEEMVLSVRAELSEALTEVLVQQAREPAVPGPSCSGCGQAMHSKGKKRRYVRTRTGEVQVERDYYYCDGCQRGFFPPR
ncbi:MAG: hypothetical protein ACYDEO_29240 [Aggregatilineales bacterium]